MGKVFQFPAAEALPEWERTIRATLARAYGGKLPAEAINTISKDVGALMQTLDSGISVQVQIPSTLGPEELRGIVADVVQQTAKIILGRAMEERAKLWVDGRITS